MFWQAVCILCVHNMDYKEKILKVFIGNAPAIFTFAHSDALQKALAKQNMSFEDGFVPRDLERLNYSTLVQDMVNIGNETAKTEEEVIAGKEAESNMDAFRKNFATVMRAQFLEVIQDVDVDPVQKVCYCLFCRKFFEAMKYIYQVELIQDHIVFMKELLDCEEHYRREIWRLHQLSEEALANMPPAVFAPASAWKYGVEQLTELSQELFDEQFTEHKDAFRLAFAATNPILCNWLKPRTTLVYFLWLLFDKGKDKVQPGTINVVCERFLINGKKTTPKIAQSTNIKPQTDKPQKRLNGHYYTLSSICKGIRFQ
jgi:hypothetical protein